MLSQWWFSDEHLELTNRKNTKEARRKLKEWLLDMNQTQLVVQYQNSAPISGPIVSIIETEASKRGVMLVRLHTALYHNVIDVNGALGRYYWPIAVKLLQLPVCKRLI